MRAGGEVDQPRADARAPGRPRGRARSPRACRSRRCRPARARRPAARPCRPRSRPPARRSRSDSSRQLRQRLGVVDAAAGDHERALRARAAPRPRRAARRSAGGRRATVPGARLEEAAPGSRTPRPARPGGARASPRRSRRGRAGRASPPAARSSSCSGRVIRSKNALSGRNASFTVRSRLERRARAPASPAPGAGSANVSEGSSSTGTRLTVAVAAPVSRLVEPGPDRGGARRASRAGCSLAGVPDRRVHHRLLVLRLVERERAALVLLERRPEPAHVAVPEDPEDAGHHAPARAVALAPLGAQVAHERLGGGEPDALHLERCGRTSATLGTPPSPSESQNGHLTPTAP